MHQRVATVLAAQRDEAARHVASTLPADADLCEVRLDALWPTVPGEEQAAADLEALLDAAHVPLIATLRPTRQGGRFQGDEQVRANLLAAAAKAGFAWVDLEADTKGAANIAHHLSQGGAKTLLSHHVLLPPSRETGLQTLSAMQDTKANLHKLAYPIGAFPDILRALELAHAHAGRNGHPCLTPHGGGAWVRALLALAGNQATYGHASGSAPATAGQPALADVAAVWRHWGLAKKDLDALSDWPAPWLAILGTPVGHSLSPRIQNAALRAAGRQERFGALDVPASAGALRLVASVASRIGLLGASVTAPHKVDAARLGHNDAVATACGAANCLKFQRDQVLATNTDATALRRLLAPHLPKESTAVILGAGGAARAAAWAARQCGAHVVFTSRDAERAKAFAKDLEAKWVPWADRATVTGQAWIQATPLGMHASDVSPLSIGRVKGKPAVVEMVYAHGATALQREAQSAGCTVIDGKQILIEQAADAFRFWFGLEPDVPAMAKSIEGKA